MNQSPTQYHRWIKSECGRAKLADLKSRQGLPAQLRLGWFVVIAALRDWNLPNPDHNEESDS